VECDLHAIITQFQFCSCPNCKINCNDALMGKRSGVFLAKKVSLSSLRAVKKQFQFLRYALFLYERK
jgi:hypothetical protein